MPGYDSDVYGSAVYDGVGSTSDTRYPSIVVELALATQPTQAPFWQVVTDKVQAFSFSRGRPDEWTAVQAGQGTLRLDNMDRRFDPTYTAGPYYGLLKRMRRVRIRATWNGATYPLFSGYVDRWPQAWSSWQSGDAYVDLPIVDGFAVLARYNLNASYPQQRSDQRIAQVLTDVQWTTGQGWLLGDATYGVLGTTTVVGPVGDRALDTGRTTVMAATLSGENALSHLQAVERSENGQFFVSSSGAMVFRNRLRRQVNTAVNVAIYGDRPDSGELMYVDAEVADDAPLATNVQITQDGGSTFTASDAASAADYFPATYSYTSLAASTGEIDSAAHWWLGRLKDPVHRISALVLDGVGNPSLMWPRILAAELGDRITVRRRPQSLGATMERDCFIEGIQCSWSITNAGTEWASRWSLSAADTRTYWILGTSPLGTSTRLAYALLPLGLFQPTPTPPLASTGTALALALVLAALLANPRVRRVIRMALRAMRFQGIRFRRATLSNLRVPDLVEGVV